MAGTQAGGKKTAITNKDKYGTDFYRNIGRKGGSKSHPETRPFALNPELAKRAGAKGGSVSKRGRAKKTIKREQAEAEAASICGLAKILQKLRKKHHDK